MQTTPPPPPLTIYQHPLSTSVVSCLLPGISPLPCDTSMHLSTNNGIAVSSTYYPSPTYSNYSKKKHNMPPNICRRPYTPYLLPIHVGIGVGVFIVISHRVALLPYSISTYSILYLSPISTNNNNKKEEEEEEPRLPVGLSIRGPGVFLPWGEWEWERGKGEY